MQPDAARTAFTEALQGFGDADLAGLGVIVPALGSLVLGLAVAAGELAPDAARDLAELDALWQAGRWGRGCGGRGAAAGRSPRMLRSPPRFMILCRA